jgi:5'-nucleotidase
MEGLVARVPSISASMGSFDKLLYEDCARFIRYLVEMVGTGSLGNDILLNVNYPNLPVSEIKGVAVTRLGVRWYDDVIHERVDPRGEKYFWITGKKVLHGREPGTDSFELDRGYVSITPLTLDLTRLEIMEAVASELANRQKTGPPQGWGYLEIVGPVSSK